MRELDLGQNVLAGKEHPLSRAFAVGFSFSSRPRPIAADTRIIWRVPLVVLLLRICCQNHRSTSKRLHVLGWATRSPKTMNVLRRALVGERRPSDVLVRLDPIFDRAIDFAIGESLLTKMSSARVQIAPKGEALADEIIEWNDCYQQELEFMNSIGRSVTESWVTQVSLIRPQGARL